MSPISVPVMPPKAFGPQEPSVTAQAFGPHGSYVRISGELDLAYAARLGEAIEGEITSGHRHLVIDLTAATFLDCASVATLLRAVAPLRCEPDAAIVMAGATGIVKRFLDLLRLDRLFDIFPDLDQATEKATDADRRHVDGWRTHHPRTLLADRTRGPIQRASANAAG